MDEGQSSKYFIILILIPCLPAGRLVPLFYILIPSGKDSILYRKKERMG
jgi:hypothetical protein